MAVVKVDAVMLRRWAISDSPQANGLGGATCAISVNCSYRLYREYVYSYDDPNSSACLNLTYLVKPDWQLLTVV